MKNYVLLLLCAVAFMSCTKEVIEIRPHDRTVGVVKDTSIKRPGIPPVTPPPTTTDTALLVSRDATNSDHVIEGSVSYALLNATVATVDIQVKGITGTLQTLPVHLTVTNNGTGAANAVVTTLRIYNAAGIQLDSELVPEGSNPEVIFRNMNLAIAAGSTDVFTIKADIAPIDGTIVALGASVQVNITSADVSQIVTMNAGSVITPSNRLFGSFVGPTVITYVAGINVTSDGFTATNTYSNPGGSLVHGIYSMTIPFSVTAFGADSFVPSVATLITEGTPSSPTITTGPSIQYIVENGTLLPGATAVVVYAGAGSMTVDAHGNYQIPAGQTRNFVLQITYTSPGPGSCRARVVNVNSNTTDSGTNYVSFTTNMSGNNFSTPYVAGQ